MGGNQAAIGRGNGIGVRCHRCGDSGRDGQFSAEVVIAFYGISWCLARNEECVIRTNLQGDNLIGIAGEGKTVCL